MSLFVITILHTYSNLSGLVVKAGHTRAAFLGEDAEFEVILARQSERPCFGITLSWPESSRELIDLDDRQQQSVRLFYRTRERERQQAGRLLIESYYPLGLLRCWSWVDLDMSCIVYPKPIPNPWHMQHSYVDNEGEVWEAHGLGMGLG